MSAMILAADLIHRDDRGPVSPNGTVDASKLAGRTIRVKITGAFTILRASRSTVHKMVELGILERGGRIGSATATTRWILLDPGDTRQTLYERWLARPGRMRSHSDLDRYMRVREILLIPAAQMPPPRVIDAMLPKLLQIGGANSTEWGAFTPLDPKTEPELRRLLWRDGVQRVPRGMWPRDACPTDEMVLEALPGLRGAPGTYFENLVGDDDFGRPRDQELRAAWSMGPLRKAALLWAFVAAATYRRPSHVQTILRGLRVVDAEIARRHGDDATVDGAMIAEAMEHVAFSPDVRFSERSRQMSCINAMLALRQIRAYARGVDRDGGRGIAAAVPPPQPDRLDFAARLAERYGHLPTLDRSARKRTSDPVSDRMEELCDVAALRLEKVVATQKAGKAAADRLLGREPGVSYATPYETFTVETTVMTERGELLRGSQICHWRAWRERDLWLDMAARAGKTNFRNHGQIIRHVRAIEADPDAYTNIVFEWVGCTPLHGDRAIAPWFVTICKSGALVAPASMSLRQRRRRHGLMVAWRLPAYYGSTTGLLNQDRRGGTLWRWARERERHVVPLDEFAFAMRFAALAFATVDETMCRLGELLQMRQDADAFPIDRSTGTAEVSFLAIPKMTRFVTELKEVRFGISQELFVEATELAADVARANGHADGALPEIEPTAGLSDRRTDRAAWLFQYGGRAISRTSMSRFLRFLFANVLIFTFHDVRHASANAAREAGVPEEAVQALLNHSKRELTGYYSRRSRRQVARAQVASTRRRKTRAAAGAAMREAPASRFKV